MEDLQSKYPYSVQVQENADQEKLRIWTFVMQWLSCPYLIFKIPWKTPKTEPFLSKFADLDLQFH